MPRHELPDGSGFGMYSMNHSCGNGERMVLNSQAGGDQRGHGGSDGWIFFAKVLW
jgi:hypothetical protein